MEKIAHIIFVFTVNIALIGILLRFKFSELEEHMECCFLLLLNDGISEYAYERWSICQRISSFIILFLCIILIINLLPLLYTVFCYILDFFIINY